MVLLQQRGVAELPSSGQSGLLPGHPLRHESVREQPHVFLDLVTETIVTWLSAQKPAQLRRERSQSRFSTCPHTYPSSCSSRRAQPSPAMRSLTSAATETPPA
jgi:hypothetical protein